MTTSTVSASRAAARGRAIVARFAARAVRRSGRSRGRRKPRASVARRAGAPCTDSAVVRRTPEIDEQRARRPLGASASSAGSSRLVERPPGEHDDGVRSRGGESVQRPDEQDGRRDEPRPRRAVRARGAAGAVCAGPRRYPPAVTAVLFTCAGQRVDIVSAFARAGATTVATDLDPLAPALYHADQHALAPRIDDDGYVALPARARRGARRPARRAADRPRPREARPCARRARRARPASLGGGRPRASATSTSRTSSSRSAGSRRRRAGCPTRCPTTPATRCSSRCARASARATSTAPATGPSSTSSSATRRSTRSCRRCCRGEEFSIDVFCDLDGRCLNAIPRTMIQSKGGESIKGMTIAGPRPDRVRRARSPRRSGSSARARSSASARRTGATR